MQYMHPDFMHGPWLGVGPLGGVAFAGLALLLVLLVLWELVWKGLALWHAAKNGQVWWFIAFLLIHTAGILEIIYLFAFRTDRKTNPLFSHHSHAAVSHSPAASDSSGAPAA